MIQSTDMVAGDSCSYRNYYTKYKWQDHSFSISISNALPDLDSNHDLKEYILNIDCLFIDEISMVHTTLFEAINEVFQHAKANELLFGGCQVIAMGDFNQLIPVSPTGNACVKNTSLFSYFKEVRLNTLMRCESESLRYVLEHVSRHARLNSGSYNYLATCYFYSSLSNDFLVKEFLNTNDTRAITPICQMREKLAKRLTILAEIVG